MQQYKVIITQMAPNPWQAEKLSQFVRISNAIREWFTECLIDGVYNLDTTRGKKLPLKQALADCCGVSFTQQLPKIFISCLLSEMGHAWVDNQHDADYMRVLKDLNYGRLIMPYKGQQLLKSGGSIYIAGLGRVRIDPITVTVISRIECYKSSKDWLADIRINKD